MQQGKHTEYEKNLHEELSMSSSSVSANQHPAATTHSDVSAPSSTLREGREILNSSSPSGQVVAPNGRATSENSDKLSRTPSPHHQITNGGWPNLGMDSKKSRYVNFIIKFLELIYKSKF